MKVWLVEAYLLGQLEAATHRKAPDLDGARREALTWFRRYDPSAFYGPSGPLLVGFELRVTEVAR